ncbi:unnamed protein product [Closterium sp. NIES-53]
MRGVSSRHASPSRPPREKARRTDYVTFVARLVTMCGVACKGDMAFSRYSANHFVLSLLALRSLISAFRVALLPLHTQTMPYPFLCCLGIRLGSIFLPIWLNSCHLRRRPPRRSFVRPLSSSSRVISIARIASLIAGVAMVLSRTTSEDRNKEDAVLEPVFANRYMQQPVKRYSSRTARARARARPSRPHSALPPSLTCTPAIPAPVFLGPPFPLPLLYPLRDPLSSAASCHAFPSAAYSPPPPTRSLSMTDALAPPRLLLTPFQHLLPLSSSCLSPLPFPLSPIRLIRFPFTHTRSPPLAHTHFPFAYSA